MHVGEKNVKIPGMVHLLKAYEKSNHMSHRHATLVFRSSALVAWGYNRGYRHSEVNALCSIWPSKRRGLHIVNLRITAGGRFGNARPCKNCRDFLMGQGITKATYFNGSDWVVERL